MMHKMNFCKLFSKLLLFLLSIVLWLVSALLSYVALGVLFAYKTYYSVIIINYTTIPLILILIAATFMFIVGLLGIFALFTNNRYLLVTYFVLLSILFAIEIGTFIAAYVCKLQINSYIEIGLSKTIKEIYGRTNSTHFAHPLDFLQNRFKCCGQNNYTDWQDTYWYAHRSTYELKNDTQIPQSCCVDFHFRQESTSVSSMLNETTTRSNSTRKEQRIYCTGKSSTPTNTDNYYPDGCYYKLKDSITSNFSYILIILISFFAVHLLSLISVLILINYKLQLLKKSAHPPYVNIEAEYEDEYTNQVVQS